MATFSILSAVLYGVGALAGSLFAIKYIIEPIMERDNRQIWHEAGMGNLYDEMHPPRK